MRIQRQSNFGILASIGTTFFLDDYKKLQYTQCPGHLCQQVFRSNEQAYLSHHACHAVYLFFPRKANTVSQPASAWKNCKPNARGPSAFDISWIGIHLRSVSLPKVIHNVSISSFSNIEIAKTTTYVSVLITKDVFNPWTAECFT